MDKQSVIRFFDRLAPGWDAEMVRSDEIIGVILDNANVTEGKHVLDVACGTGVLIPDYRKRRAASVTAIDISPEMVKLAREKFSSEEITPEEERPESTAPEKQRPESTVPERPALTQVRILCGDVEETDFDRRFDCVVVYNAFPHFPDPERLIRRLSGLLVPGGTLTVAHGMSREKINAHHSGTAVHVSVGLMEAEKLADIFRRYLTVTAVVSDEKMYQVAGTKPAVIH